MKKSFLYIGIIGICFFSALLTGCISMALTELTPSVSSSVNYNKFYGSSNPNYGYEGFFWGTNYETIKEKQVGI